MFFGEYDMYYSNLGGQLTDNFDEEPVKETELI